MNDIMKDVITARHRPSSAGARPYRSARQDRHHQPVRRHLVQRIQRQPGCQRVGGQRRQHPLGAGEEGARTAVPIWVDYMREALRGVPEKTPHDAGWHHRDEGECRRLAARRTRISIRVFEYFRTDMLPTDEGYLGDREHGPQTLDPTAPETPQTSSDPIF